MDQRKLVDFCAHCHRYANPGHYLGLGPTTAKVLSDWARAASRTHSGYDVFIRASDRCFCAHVMALHHGPSGIERVLISAKTSKALLEKIQSIHRACTNGENHD